MEIVRKAYIVWHEGMLSHHPDQGYRISDIPPVYAETSAKAKAKSYLHREFDIDGRPPIYTDLKVRRAKNADIVLMDGADVPRWRAIAKNKRIEREERIISQIKSSDDSHFLIQKGFVGNCLLFWKKGKCGYTCELSDAELFTKEEALNMAIGLDDQNVFWGFSAIQGASSLMVDHQKLVGFKPIS